MKRFTRAHLKGIKSFCALLVLAAVLSLSLFYTIADADSTAPDETNEVTLDDLAGKRAGVMTGTPQDEMVKNSIRDPQLYYYNSFTDMALALESGKIDYYVNSTIAFRMIKDTYPSFTCVDQVIKQYDIGSIFPMTDEGEALRKEFNEYIADITEDGTLAQLQDYWFYLNDWEAVEIPTSGENGTIVLGTCSSVKPFAMMLDNSYAGFDIAVVAGFCREYGYGLSIEDTEFASVLAGVQSGKYDIGAGQISYTEERARSVLYSDMYCTQDIVPIINGEAFGITESGDAASGELEYNSIEEIKDVKRFGAVTGTVFDEITLSYFPDAEISYYNNIVDEITALESNKIDAILYDEPTLTYIANSHDNLGMIPELLLAEDYYLFFSRDEEGTALCETFNTWLAEARADGRLDEMMEYWTSDTEITQADDPTLEAGESGITIDAVYCAGSRPDDFFVNGVPAGYPIDLIHSFCEDMGYGLSLTDVAFNAVVNSVASGRADACIALSSYTEERARSVQFSDPIYSGGVAVLVRKAAQTDTAVMKGGFFDSFVSSLKRTLLDQNRWQLILSGLLTTLIITVFGFALANLLGALFCAMAMSKKKVPRVLATIYSGIMQGTPVVVILMILYYVIFGRTKLSGVVIAIIGFGITSGAYLAQIFEGGISGVKQDQWEAALALGFTKKETFTGLILPQAVRIMLPGYFSQLISLMKGTAIVGYIAVQDLTKMGDIIRSATYEAFMPLIIVALIYLAISCVILMIMKKIQKKLSPKRLTAPIAGGEQK